MERNTPTLEAMAVPAAVQRLHRPPDVETALSSMLWTPYDRAGSSTSEEDDEEEAQVEAEDEDEDERLNRKLRKSHSSYETRNHLAIASPAATPLAVAPPVPFPSFNKASHRNRYSYPSYYGSPAHTLIQWCSSTATAIKEPPSYDSLYQPGVSGVGVARASLAAVVQLPTNYSLQCDRSQRSPANEIREDEDEDEDDEDRSKKLTANVPAERLVRSFTDDYISQVSVSINIDLYTRSSYTAMPAIHLYNR